MGVRSSTVRRVCGVSDGEVVGDFGGCLAGVAVAVGGVGLGAGGGEGGAAGGLGVLPGDGSGGAAHREWGRLEGAARSGGAGVLVDPEGDRVEVADGDLVADVLGGGEGVAGAVGDGLAADVNAGAEVGAGDGLGPGEEVAHLLGEHAAAFFLVKEENGVGGEVLAGGGGDGCFAIFTAEGVGRDVGGPDLLVELAVGEDEEAEAGAEDFVALAEPLVGARAGGIGEPVADEVDVLAEGGERGVTGVLVAVHADVASRGGLPDCVNRR